MKDKEQAVFGKIMLFGEYGILCQGKALTIPLKNFSGKLRFPAKTPKINQSVSNRQLKEYHAYLSAKEEDSGYWNINLHAFHNELKKGLYFASDIPQGYGAGSSGALVAAVYRRFVVEGQNGLAQPDLGILQNKFALLEGYFHGSSSGLDPLSCYLGAPLKFSPTEGASAVKIPINIFPEESGFFLINTGSPRKTGELVRMFHQKNREEAFQEMIQDRYNETVSSCITSLIDGNLKAVETQLKILSELQLRFFNEMVPEGFKDLWVQGLNSGYFTLKLCGAGGGGFILGFSNDISGLKKNLKNYEVTEISL
ncbi:MAG TPA: hypothetical protein VLH61_10485 [Bacteroidales bacterium]|nr:hypothetical protein [Bacteroidales bacterium]